MSSKLTSSILPSFVLSFSTCPCPSPLQALELLTYLARPTPEEQREAYVASFGDLKEVAEGDRSALVEKVVAEVNGLGEGTERGKYTSKASLHSRWRDTWDGDQAGVQRVLDGRRMASWSWDSSSFEVKEGREGDKGRAGSSFSLPSSASSRPATDMSISRNITGVKSKS